MLDSFLSVFKISLKAIFANKMRAALTSLGIIIGVAAVITVLAVGNATKKSIAERFSNMGTNIIFLRQPWDLDDSISSPKDVTMDDVVAIREKGKLWRFVDPKEAFTKDSLLLIVMEKKHMKKWQ